MKMSCLLFALLAVATTLRAGRSPDSLYYKIYESPYLWRSDKAGNGFAPERGFTWLYGQTGTAMDPAGDYIYEVYRRTLRRHNAVTGSYTDFPIRDSVRSVSCGTDGEHVYYGRSAREVTKVTVTGEHVSATNLGEYYATYHGMGVARDTFWIINSDFPPLDYRGFPLGEFTGDTAGYRTTIHNPLANVAPGMPICWDGAFFYATCGGYPANPLIRWDGEHNFLDTVMLDADIRSVMCRLPATGVKELPAPGGMRGRPATIARGSLVLSSGCADPASECVLLDLSGREVMPLDFGSNDVSRLAPGVYFTLLDDGGSDPAVRKVMIQH